MIKSYIKNFLIKENKNLLSLFLNNHELFYDEVQFLIKNSPGVWSIDSKLAEVIVSFVLDKKPKQVIEFGAGYSTLIFSYLQNFCMSPSQLISIEQNKDWFKIPTDLDRLFSKKLIPLTLAPVRFNFGYLGIYARYEIPKQVIIPSEIELLLVDGPQYYFGREGCLDFTYSKLKQGALIILDDADRYTEQCLIFKWLKVYRGLELVYFNEHFGDKGIAVLKVKSPIVKRFSFSAFILGIYQGLKRYVNVNMNSRRLNKKN